MTGEQIRFELVLDDDQFVVRAAGLRGQLAQMQGDLRRTAEAADRMSGHMTGLTGSVRSTVLSLAAFKYLWVDFYQLFLALPQQIARTTGEFQRLETMMRGLSAQTDETKKKLEAAASVQFLKNMALGAPFDVTALGDAFVKLRTGGIDPTNGSLKALVDSVARFGGTSETLKRASVAIQQMGGKGVISMEELRQQLGEAIPDAMQKMAVATGVSMAELTKQVSKGVVASGPALERFFAVLQVQNSGAAADMMKTWPGMLSQLETRWKLFSETVGNAGFMSALEGAMKQLLALFDDPAFTRFARDLGIALGQIVTDFVELTKWVRENIDLLTMLAKAAIVFAGVKVGAGILESMKAINDRTRAQLAAKALAAAEERKIEMQRIADQANAVLREEAIHRQKVANLIRANQEIKAQMLKAQAEQRLLQATEDARLARVATFIGPSNTAGKDRTDYVLTNARLRDNIQWMEKARDTNFALIAAERQKADSANASAAAIVAKNAAMSTGIGVTGALATAVKGLQFAFNALGGWLGVITLAITLGIAAWEKWGNAAEKAVKQARDRIKVGAAEAQDVVALGAQITQTELDIEEKRQQLALARQSKAALKNVPGANILNDKAIETYEQQIAGLEKKLVELNKNRADATKQAVDNEAREISSIYDREIKQAVDATELIGRKRLEEINKRFIEEKRAAEGNQKALSEIATRESEATRIAVLETANEKLKVIATERQKLYAALEQKPSQQREKAIYASLESLKQLEDQANALKSAGAKIGTLTTVAGKDGAGSGAGDGVDVLKKMLIDAQTELANAQSKFSDLENGVRSFAAVYDEEMRKVKAEFDKGAITRGSGKDKQTLTFDANREMAEMIAVLRAKKILEDQAIAAQKGLQQEYSRTQGIYQELAAEFADPGSFEIQGREILKLVGKLNEYRQQLDAAGGLTDDMRALLARLAQTEVQATLSKSMQEGIAIRRETLQTYADIAGQISSDVRDKEIADFERADRIKRQILEAEVARIKAAQEQGAVLSDQEVATLQTRWTDYYQWRNAQEELLRLKTRSANQKLADEWGNVMLSLERASTGWMNGFIDTIVDGLAEGKLEFKSFVDSILKDLLRITMQKTIGNALADVTGGLGKGFGALLGFLGPAGGSGSGMGFSGANAAAAFTPGVNFANGGVMTEFGPLQLRKYAMGGVANTPQMAIYGEGSRPEAYVPLPDGRTIPVTMQNGAAPQVTVNVINQSGQPVNAKQGGARFDGKQMILDVVLEAAANPGPFRDSMKGALK
jgi:tape measure domain-containing protein